MKLAIIPGGHENISRTFLHKNDKITFYLPRLDGGGVERTFVNVANVLHDSGISVDFVLAKADGAMLGKLRSDLNIVDLESRGTLASLPRFSRYLRNVGPACVFSALTHANLVTLWARSLARARSKVVISEHAPLKKYVAMSPRRKEKFYPFLIPLFYSRSDEIIAVSREVAEDVVRVARVSASRIRVVPNAVVTPDLRYLEKADPGHSWLTQDKRKPVIISAARLSVEKGAETLLHAFSILRASVDARLILLGEGDLENRLKFLAKELGIGADVCLVGFVDNPFAYFARADLFVLPSVYEGFGNVLIEALACGCPVVSTRSGPVAEEILGASDLLVPPGDPEALANSMRCALKRPHKKNQLREIASKYSAERAASTFRQIAFGSPSHLTTLEHYRRD